jgi:hypothetical protein
MGINGRTNGRANIVSYRGATSRLKIIRRKKKRRIFQEKEEAWAARVCGYTMQGNLFALLQAENESIK